MFYIYMIGSIIISLFLIGIAYLVPMYVLKEFDKMTYVNNYKQKMKWYKIPLYYIREILTYMTLIFSLMILVIFGVSGSLRKKQFKEVFRSMFVTPLVGIGLSLVIFYFICTILYSIEFNGILGLFVVIYFTMLFIMIPYYIVLIIKQIINIIKVENKQLEEYNEFKSKNGNKKQLIGAILSSVRKEEYIKKYLQIYKTEEEWKESNFVLINYKYYYNLLIIIFILGTIANLILSIVENEIFMMNVITIQGYFIAMIAGITIFLNWIYNSTMILDIKVKRKCSKISMVKFMLSGILGIIIMLILLPIITGSNKVIYSGEGYNYQAYKEEAISNIKHKRDYENYNTYERLSYILGYPKYFEDDLNKFGYMLENGIIYVSIENKKLLDYFTNNDKNRQSYYLAIEKTQIFVTDQNREKINKTEIILENNDDFYNYNSEEVKQEYEKEYYSYNYKYKYLANNDIEKLMKEQTVEVINNIWSEEMKGRKLE